MLEVYADDCISLAIAKSKKDLDHTVNARMHEKYSMFPASTIESKDPISEKKMIKKDGQWRVEKGILG